MCRSQIVGCGGGVVECHQRHYVPFSGDQAVLLALFVDFQ